MKNKITVFTSAITLVLVLVVMCSYQLKVDQIAIVTTLVNQKQSTSLVCILECLAGSEG